jgi:hypothetical protein
MLLTLVAVGGLALGLRFIRVQERRGLDAGQPNVVIHNTPNNEISGEGGFQFFEVNDLQKKAFIDAFNGFKEYAELKGYNVTVIVDSSKPGMVGLKIVVDDAGVTVSTNQVRADVNEYVRKMRDQDDLADMPIVTDPIEHARLVAAVKMRFEFLRHQAQMNATAAEAYRAILSAVAKEGLGAIGYLPAPLIPNVTVQIQNDGARLMSNTNSSTNTATNSPGAAVGQRNRAGITASWLLLEGLPLSAMRKPLRSTH